MEFGILKRRLFSAGKIQISSETKMLIDLAGGFVTEERGYVEIKVRIETESDRGK